MKDHIQLTIQVGRRFQHVITVQTQEKKQFLYCHTMAKLAVS